MKLNKVYKLLWSHFRLFCYDIQYLVIVIVGASIANHLQQVSDQKYCYPCPPGKERVSFKIFMLTERQFYT